MLDIIIPVYNGKDTLRNTLNSINSQTIKDNCNIYIIDDNSICRYDDNIRL